MTAFKQDVDRLQTLAGDAFMSTGELVNLANKIDPDPEKMQKVLEQTAARFESISLQARRLCEIHSPGAGSYGKVTMPPCIGVAGSVDLPEPGWVHIKLNTLLPHCRFQSPEWLTDTIMRLLDSCERGGAALPFFTRALLIIDEHSCADRRQIFDQDNKGWKAVSNAIKGRLIPDDDQYTLSLALLSTRSRKNACHITLMDLADAPLFFARRLEERPDGQLGQGEAEL